MDALQVLVDRLNDQSPDEAIHAVFHRVRVAAGTAHCNSKLPILFTHWEYVMRHIVAPRKQPQPFAFNYTLIDILGSASKKARMLDGLAELFTAVPMAIPTGMTVRFVNYVSFAGCRPLQASASVCKGGGSKDSSQLESRAKPLVQIGDVIQGLGQTIDMQRYWALIQTTGNHLLFDAPEVRSLMECMPGEKMPLFKKLIIWMAASELELQLTFYIQERFEALTAAEGALFDEQGEEGAATVHVSCRVFGRAPTLTTTNPRNGVSKIRAAYRLLMLCLDRHYPVAQREIFRSSLLSYLDEDLDLTRSFGDGVVELERCDIRALTGCGTELPEVVSEYADNVPEALQDTLGIREAAIASAAAAK